MNLSIVFIHYRTPDLLGRAIESLPASLASDRRETELAVEIVVVDNGSEPADRHRFRDETIRWVDPGRNLGFAGGVNLGFQETLGEWVVIVNPDTELHPGCLSRLLRTGEAGGDVVGPRLEWEDGWWHPPTEQRSFLEEGRRALGTRQSWAARWARKAWRQHARNHWETTGPIQSPWLSGALVLIRREVFNEVGDFDESFPLYFEETDWLLRAHRAGKRILYEPRASAWHQWGASTQGESRSSRWFEESRGLFFRKWYGLGAAALLERIALPLKESDSSTETKGEMRAGGENWWAELSPSPSGYPAAGRRLRAGESAIPSQGVRKRMGTNPWWLRLVDAEGREREMQRVVAHES